MFFIWIVDSSVFFDFRRAGITLIICIVPTPVSLINKFHKEILLLSRAIHATVETLKRIEKGCCSWIEKWIGMGWWVLSLGWVLRCFRDTSDRSGV